jgi:hypothetical protein
MLQKPICENEANLLLSTHISKEADIQNAIKELNGLEFVKDKTAMIRIDS